MQKQDPAEIDIHENKIKQGYLVKRSRIIKQWRKRWMVLTRTHLYSFQQKGIYRNATEKIALKDITTIKSFHKNQYQLPQVFRIQSDDAYFYLSAESHQDKWGWMTAVEKTVNNITNPHQDSQNLIRQTLRMTTAVRQSSMIPRKTTLSNIEELQNPMKKSRLKLQTRTIGVEYVPKIKSALPLEIEKLPNFTWVGQNGQRLQNKNVEGSEQKVLQRVVEIEKIIKIPVQVEKIIERQRIIYVKTQSQNSSSLQDLFAALINSKLDDPKPLLDFVAYLGLSGIERYQSVALEFCCERDSHRFFSELLLQALNEEILEERLNRYTAFSYILCERQPDFFYKSDLKILCEIVVRELELYRSDLSQMINLQMLKTLLTYQKAHILHKRNEIHSIAAQIATLGPHKNRELAQQICVLIN